MQLLDLLYFGGFLDVGKISFYLKTFFELEDKEVIPIIPSHFWQRN